MPRYNPNHGQHAISDLATNLPYYIKGLYYYDYIGNISTSHATRNNDAVYFEIEPRFPIFGQWKTDWNQGYNMPSQYHLFQNKADQSEFTLEVDFMHAYDSSTTEEYQVNVILPEGASNLRIDLPFTCGVKEEDISLGKYFGTLDFFGRPKLTILKKNAVHDLCDNVLTVRYTLSPTALYQKVVAMFALLFALFSIAMLYMRVGLSLGDKKVMDAKLKSN